MGAAAEAATVMEVQEPTPGQGTDMTKNPAMNTPKSQATAILDTEKNEHKHRGGC